ncbi:MAG: hypothetical protein V3U54_08610 [Thermodesulfobacteriota bacterium]
MSTNWEKQLHLTVHGGWKDEDGKKVPRHFKVYLDHSCNDWEIGNEEDAQELSADLALVWKVAKNLKEAGALKKLHLYDEIAWWLSDAPVLEKK